MIICSFVLCGCSFTMADINTTTKTLGQVEFLSKTYNQALNSDNDSDTFIFEILSPEDGVYGYKRYGMFATLPTEIIDNDDFNSKYIQDLFSNDENMYFTISVLHRSELILKGDQTRFYLQLYRADKHESLYFVVWLSDGSLYSYKVK